ncbi:DUF6221 family protein [Streptomyces iakyrus]|uniref:DUF6221 family protein n=1 Tax=Streptomyces iakyrus TaxID=68219 RepID=UPI000523F42A|nr:DUF6221 family protein [Streptomyces iakyrus]
MDELVRWLGDQLDEDERIARAAIRVVGDVPGAANWRFGNAFTDEGGTYWQITTLTPDVGGFGPVELVGSGMSGGGAHEPEIARHAVEHDPARVLREIDAKRQVVDMYVKAATVVDNFTDPANRLIAAANRNGFGAALKALALPYADRPGYREEWRP